MKTYSDIYKFPLHIQKYSSWVWDEADNFVFQFEFRDAEKRELLVKVINGECNLTNTSLVFHHKDGYILTQDNDQVILIRGWGGLTGIGGHNLEQVEAANIQDTFADYIVERLNYRVLTNKKEIE